MAKTLYASLYVHFPFCESKCHYCDFYSLGKEKTKPTDPAQFEAALFEEARLWENELAPQMKTIFFGGGTPSMTEPSAMARALSPLKLESRLNADTEWTMEANPSSIEKDKMRAYRGLGINRISMGVQAMRDDLLSNLGRVHTQKRALQALEAVFTAGFSQVSVDLLCGVPGQSIADLDSAMAELLSFPITHLSCYLLTLPKHHRMYPELPDEETQLAHLLFIDQKMTAQGFNHYEISNFARPGCEARHNLNYWQGDSYLGLGPSAHSFDLSQRKRWKNFSSLHKYGDRLKARTQPLEWEEILSPEQSSLEKWMLALRLSEGFPVQWTADLKRANHVHRLKTEGLIESHPQVPDRLRLTPRGFALSDQIISLLA